jgi:hypothetical protein
MHAMRHGKARHPVFRIVMHDQGRSLTWLARETRFSHSYVKQVSAGLEKGSPRFRAACAALLGMSEAMLFHADSSAPPHKEAESTRAGTAAMYAAG